MKRIIEKVKKSSVKSRVLASALAATVCVTSIWHGFANDTPNAKAAEGSGSEKTYISYIIDRMIGGLQDKFTILEIVPHQSQGEFRYWVGDDEVEEGLESNRSLMEAYYATKGFANKPYTTTDIWYDLGSDFSNFGYQFRYESANDRFEVESPKRFLNYVVPEYKELLDGNIDMRTVEANDLTADDLTQADFIIITTGTHDESTIDCYTSFTNPDVTNINEAGVMDVNVYTGTVNADGTSDNMTKVTGKSDITYDTFEKTDEGKYISRDISWDMVELLWQYTIKGKTVTLPDGSTAMIKIPVIMDNQKYSEMKADNNMFKYQLLFRMLSETQFDTVYTYISKTDVNGDAYINSGNIATAELSPTKSFPADADVSWNRDTDVWGIIGNPYTYPNLKTEYEDYNPAHAQFLTDNYWVYSGAPCLIPSNLTNTYYSGTSSADELGFYERVGSSATVVDVMRYLLGAKDKPVVNYNNPVLKNGQIKILEIQPTAGTDVFKYDTYAEVKALATKMLLAVDGKDAEGNQLFDALTEDNYNDPNAKTCIYVECISSSGFNGINDDIIADYDVIFLGDNSELMLKDANGSTIYNDTSLNGYIYLAFGDLIKCKTGISVYYPEDYTKITNRVNTNGFTLVNNTLWNDRLTDSPWPKPIYDANGEELKDAEGNVVYEPQLDRYGNVVLDNQGRVVYVPIPWKSRNSSYLKVYKLDTKLWNPLLYNSSSMTVGNYYVLTDATSEALNASSQADMLADKTGLVRLSGNDITQLKCNQLKEFVDSGKLLVLGEELYNYTSSSKTIYPTSNMAEIAQYAIDKDANRIKESRIGAMLLHLRNQNPKILDLKAPTEVEFDSNGMVAKFNATGTDLNFSFKIDGKPNTTYQVSVYGDKNNDGVYNKTGDATDDTNERYYRDEWSTNENGISEVAMKAPLSDDYNGLMSYRLEVVELSGSTELPYRAGITGYTAIKGTAIKNINVLQILPVPYRDIYYADKGLNLDMETDPAFNKLIEDAEDTIGYNIEVESVFTEEYENWFESIPYNNSTPEKKAESNWLAPYDMVVIGFGDLYCSDDISNDNGALTCLNDFINSGKAVLFTHDTVGYSNTVNGMYVADNVLNKHSTNTWATSLSRMFRVAVGMDRFRITEAESMSASEFNNVPYDKNGNPVLYGLQGVTNMLAYRHSVATQAANDAVDFETSVPGSGKYLLYPYTTGSISNYTKLMETTKVTKLNDGQVTMYPYAISDSLTVAETHSQWYQLDMEDPEIVVWYTLAGDGNGTAEEYAKYGYENASAAEKAGATLDQYYIDNDKDAGNNYYIYSKKNITYSGAGHSSMDSPEELKLFVNTVVKAITAGNSVPEVVVKESSYADGYHNVYVTPYSGDYSYTFIGKDADLLSGTGRFKTAKVTLTNVDTDGNGTLTTADYITWDLGTDLVCDTEVKVTIKEGGEGPFDAYATKITELIDSVSGATFTIQITDMYGEMGEANVKLVKRDLFNMD